MFMDNNAQQDAVEHGKVERQREGLHLKSQLAYMRLCSK